MKHKNLILDFTSLLDVIMIILFVVLSSTGKAAADAEEEAAEQLSGRIAAEEALSGVTASLSEAESKLLQAGEEQASLSAELQKNIARNQALQQENNRLNAALGNRDVDYAGLYESMLEHAEKFTLTCSTFVNEHKSGSNEVEITIHRGENALAEQEARDIVTFTHNLDLSREERLRKNAEMQADLYTTLKGLIEKDPPELLLITVIYTYADKNFSQTDLDLITGAVSDLERTLSVKCYIDKVKQ